MKNRQFQQEKHKILPRQKCRDIVSKCHDIISMKPGEAMSQEVALCHNKDKVELKPKTKIVATSHNFVAT